MGPRAADAQPAAPADHPRATHPSLIQAAGGETYKFFEQFSEENAAFSLRVRVVNEPVPGFFTQPAGG